MGPYSHLNQIEQCERNPREEGRGPTEQIPAGPRRTPLEGKDRTDFNRTDTVLVLVT